jgi:hypothetical protein
MPKGKSDDQIRRAVEGASSLRELIQRLGLRDSGSNYATLRKRLDSLGIERPRRWGSDAVLREAVAQESNIADVLRRLKLVPRGGNYEILRRRIRALGLDTSHFRKSGWRRGVTTPVVAPKPLSEILVAGRPCSSNGLKRRLIREGLKESRCENCLRETWNGGSIPLELDHCNGVRDDNRLENLRLLCPNCHAGTPNYRGRNIRKGSTTQ